MIKKIYNERVLITKFVIVGACGFVVNYLVLRICNTTLGINRVVSEVLAAIVALQVTFYLNDRWTYQVTDIHAKLTHSFRARYFAYLATNSFGSLMTVVMFSVFSLFLHRLLALGAGAVAAMVWNYAVNRVFIWRRVPEGDA